MIFELYLRLISDTPMGGVYFESFRQNTPMGGVKNQSCKVPKKWQKIQKNTKSNSHQNSKIKRNKSASKKTDAKKYAFFFDARKNVFRITVENTFFATQKMVTYEFLPEKSSKAEPMAR